MLEVENVHGRVSAACVFNALRIVSVVVPFSLTARQHFFTPYLVAQVAVSQARSVVRLLVCWSLVYLRFCGGRYQE